MNDFLKILIEIAALLIKLVIKVIFFKKYIHLDNKRV